jgi:glycosyltransferase involved in cell wall biosynthesis
MSKYKIIHLGKYYPPVPGGIESHVQTLARAQVKLGYRTTVLCVNTLDHDGNHSAYTNTIEERDNDVKVVRLGRWTSLLKLDVCPGFVVRLWQMLRQYEEKIIFHLHTPNPMMLLASAMLSSLSLVSGKRNIHLVITHHSDVVNQRLRKYAMRPLEFLVYGKAKAVLTDSDNYLQGSKFLAMFQDAGALPLGIDLEDFINPQLEAVQFAQELNVKYGQPLWLCVGRLVYYKALHIAIAALVKVPGKLIIIGVGVLEAELRALADKLEVGDRIIWLGNATREQLIGAYHAATALWFPSNARSEGFGLVQVEAMASGCPAINANIPGSGVPWVCRHEIEGLTVPINDVEAFVRAGLRLLNEPGLRDRLGAAARIRACSEFDHMVMAKRSLEIYAEVAGD